MSSKFRFTNKAIEDMLAVPRRRLEELVFEDSYVDLNRLPDGIKAPLSSDELRAVRPS